MSDTSPEKTNPKNTKIQELISEYTEMVKEYDITLKKAECDKKDLKKQQLRLFNGAQNSSVRAASIKCSDDLIDLCYNNIRHTALKEQCDQFIRELKELKEL